MTTAITMLTSCDLDPEPSPAAVRGGLRVPWGGGEQRIDVGVAIEVHDMQGLVQAHAPREHILARTQGLRVVTDDNMGLEWRRR